MGDLSRPDLISDLPQSIIESILTRLSIREAVTTSVLSSKWRYRWSSITHLVFDDECVTSSNDRGLIAHKLINFITRVLFLHQGPIHKFQLRTSYLHSCPDIDQWILFLSRKDIKELVLSLEEKDWIRVPSCLFNCKKLIDLELLLCELEPPPMFKGFLYLKSLTLTQVAGATDAIESLISSCPLLESLSLSYDSLTLNIRAPNLKYLCLEGEFKDICLEYTPLLVVMSVTIFKSEESADIVEQGSGCNFIKLLGGVPHLEELVGLNQFTKYLSIGDYPGRHAITYSRLKIIELCEVSFEDMKEILVVLHLITNSPNLEELRISNLADGCDATAELIDYDNWEKECPSRCLYERLRVVKMTGIAGEPREMEFIKFLLEKSPVLEIMSIMPCSLVGDEENLDTLTELVRFRRASARAEILFFQD